MTEEMGAIRSRTAWSMWASLNVASNTMTRSFKMESSPAASSLVRCSGNNTKERRALTAVIWCREREECHRTEAGQEEGRLEGDIGRVSRHNDLSQHQPGTTVSLELSVMVLGESIVHAEDVSQ